MHGAELLWGRHKDALAKGVVHNDWTPSNAMRLGDGKFAILDYGEVCDGSQEFDTAIGLYNWATDTNGKPSQKKYDAFLGGYCAEKSMSQDVISSMPDMAAVAVFRFAAIRAELITQLGVSFAAFIRVS